MAQFDAAYSVGTSGSSGTLTGVAVAANTNRALYIPILVGATAQSVSSVSRDGQAATQVLNVTQGSDVRLEVWRILSPNTGTASVSVTLTGSVGELVIGALSLYDVDQATPNGAFQSVVSGSGESWSLNVNAGSVDDIAVDFLALSSGGSSNTVSPGAGQTQRIANTSTSWRHLLVSTEPGVAGTVTMSETRVANPGNNVYAAVVINNAVAGGGDTTAPTLTSPTGTATGSTTASGSVSTDEANGTLYRLASTNATETAATVKAAALTTTVSATGVQSTGVTFSGLTASTTYYAHYLHRDAAGNDSAIVSSASFTTNAPPADTTPPTLTGTITVSALTTTSYTLTWPAGSDDTGVAGYEYSLNGGGAWTDAGDVLTADITGRTPGSTDEVRVRAYDAAGNKSTPPLSTSVTLDSEPAVGTITTSPLKNNTGTLLANETGATVHVYQTTGALVVTKTGQTTDASGIMAITDALIQPATEYRIVIVLGSGAEGMDRITAA